MKDRDKLTKYYFEEDHLTATRNKIRVALFLDFDGTLVPIRRDPGQCYLSPDTKRLLESILGSGKSAVTILSGRSLSDLRKRLSVRGAFYAGSHGLEISGPGIQFVHKDAHLAKPVLDNILRAIQEQLDGCEGILIENKPYSFAIHYRNAATETVPFMRKLFYSVITREPADAQSFTVMKGKKVLELLPRVSWNKGTAALHIMRKLDGKYLPICVGDDATDETLFEAFCEKGITIRVGPSRRTAARCHLKGQWEVPFLLKQIDDRLQ
jgi:trehalose 6-phosphate phosphatase